MNNSISCSDNELVVLAQKGNRNAYTILFKRYSLKIHHIIGSRINDYTLANDLTQEVLLKIFRYLSQFKEESEFSTWVYRITQNTIKNHYRECQKQLDNCCEGIPVFEQTYQISPEMLLSYVELSKEFDKALAQLSEDLRTCFYKYEFDGLSYETISKEMNCPIGTVRSRIFRARKELMHSLNVN